MGGLVSSITGKGGSSNTGSALSGLTGVGQSALAGGDVNLSNQVAGLAGNVGGLVPGMQNIANTQQQYGGNLLSSGQQQYQAGLAGQLTPAQQALTDYTLGQNQTAMNQIYSGLGLGGSTMNTQDLNAANMQSLAQQEQIDFANQQMGLGAMGAGSGMEQAGATDIMNQGNLYGEMGNLYGEAGNLKGAAGNLLGGSQSNINNFLNLLRGAGSALGSGAGTAAGSSGVSAGLPSIGSALGGTSGLSSGSFDLGSSGLGSSIFSPVTGSSTLGDIGSILGSAGSSAGSVGTDVMTALTDAAKVAGA